MKIKTALHKKLLQQMRLQGPLSVHDYMQMVLLDDEYGYYHRHNAIENDFITSPEITPIFGELLAGWLLHHWQKYHEMERIFLIETGGGRALLMSDILRVVMKLMPELQAQLHVVMIEQSQSLQAIQQETLQAYQSDIKIEWYAHIADIIPAIHHSDEDSSFITIIGNEFLDALPIYQLIYQDNLWHERRIYYDDHDDFAYIACPDIGGLQQYLSADLPQAHHGDIMTLPIKAYHYCQEIAQIMKLRPSLSLMIDYGDDIWCYGDDFQALRQHQKLSPLDYAGECDVTARVNFPFMQQAFEQFGIDHHLMTQADFLYLCGLKEKIAYLTQYQADKADYLHKIEQRLCGEDMMGQLFKCLICHHLLDDVLY
jgi:NADH dehydrogenase [ubiquinone] 1 alpha subcomplex assembly factor 7